MPKSTRWAMSKRSQKVRKNTARSPKGPDGLKLSSRPLTVTGSSRADQAIERMGITAEEMVRHPNVTEILKRTIGSRENIIAMMRFSSDDSINQFLDIWDRVPQGDQTVIPFEAICIKGRVNAMALLGATVATAKVIMGNESALVTMMEHPEVVRKTIEYAKTLPAASADRKMVHDAVGWLPKASGIQIVANQQNNQAGTRGRNEQESPTLDVPLLESQSPKEAFTTAFPSVNSNLEKWGERRRQLIAPPKQIEAKFDEVIGE